MRRTSPWRLLLAAFLLLALAEAGRADEFSAVEHQRQTIYHSPQTPGYTCWVGAWIMPDGDLMTCFTQATGPVEGRPKAPREVMDLLSWYPQYDMTGLDLHNVHLRSSDAGQTWMQVSADPFKTCMNGVTGEAQSVLPDGTIVRGVFGLYLPYDRDLPKTGFLQRSTDGTKTWGNPEVLLDPEKTTVWPRRIRTLRDGRVLLLLGVSPLPAAKHTRKEFSNRLEPTILISSDQGRTWSKPLRAAPEDQITGFTEEFDVAELDNGDLLTIYRRIDDAKRWQGILKKADGTWVPGKVGPIELPHSGQPELLKTLQGPVLHIATSGIHWTSDAGQTWNKLNVPGTAYYPRSVQARDGRIFVFGHVGGDDAYGKVDQSIVMDSFLLRPKTTVASWKMHNVRRLAGGATEQIIPARLQIVTENWNRVVAVPYITYMPEKDRLSFTAERTGHVVAERCRAHPMAIEQRARLGDDENLIARRSRNLALGTAAGGPEPRLFVVSHDDAALGRRVVR